MGGHPRNISGRGAIVLAVLLLAALLVPGAASAAKLKTRSKSAVVPATEGAVTSLTVKCPRGMRVIGGGFAASAPGSAAAGANNQTVYESRRVGQRRWRASSVQANTLVTSPGTFTVYAHCRRVEDRIRARSKTTPVGPLSASNPSDTATAKCPPRTKAIGGGFTTTPFDSPAGPTDPTSLAVVNESFRSRRNEWTATAWNLVIVAGQPVTVTSHVYCLGGPRPKQRTGAGTVPTLPATASVTTAPCPRRTRPGAGGYSAPVSTTPPGHVPYVFASRRVGRTWLVGGTTALGGPSPLTAFAYCS